MMMKSLSSLVPWFTVVVFEVSVTRAGGTRLRAHYDQGGEGALTSSRSSTRSAVEASASSRTSTRHHAGSERVARGTPAPPPTPSDWNSTTRRAVIEGQLDSTRRAAVGLASGNGNTPGTSGRRGGPHGNTARAGYPSVPMPLSSARSGYYGGGETTSRGQIANNGARTHGSGDGGQTATTSPGAVTPVSAVSSQSHGTRSRYPVSSGPEFRPFYPNNAGGHGLGSELSPRQAGSSAQGQGSTASNPGQGSQAGSSGGRQSGASHQAPVAPAGQVAAVPSGPAATSEHQAAVGQAVAQQQQAPSLQEVVPQLFTRRHRQRRRTVDEVLSQRVSSEALRALIRRALSELEQNLNVGTAMQGRTATPAVWRNSRFLCNMLVDLVEFHGGGAGLTHGALVAWAAAILEGQASLEPLGEPVRLRLMPEDALRKIDNGGFCCVCQNKLLEESEGEDEGDDEERQAQDAGGADEERLQDTTGAADVQGLGADVQDTTAAARDDDSSSSSFDVVILGRPFVNCIESRSQSHESTGAKTVEYRNNQVGAQLERKEKKPETRKKKPHALRAIETAVQLTNCACLGSNKPCYHLSCWEQLMQNTAGGGQCSFCRKKFGLGEIQWEDFEEEDTRRDGEDTTGGPGGRGHGAGRNSLNKGSSSSARGAQGTTPASSRSTAAGSTPSGGGSASSSSGAGSAGGGARTARSTASSALQQSSSSSRVQQGGSASSGQGQHQQQQSATSSASAGRSAFFPEQRSAARDSTAPFPKALPTGGGVERPQVNAAPRPKRSGVRIRNAPLYGNAAMEVSEQQQGQYQHHQWTNSAYVGYQGDSTSLDPPHHVTHQRRNLLSDQRRRSHQHGLAGPQAQLYQTNQTNMQFLGSVQVSHQVPFPIAQDVASSHNYLLTDGQHQQLLNGLMNTGDVQQPLPHQQPHQRSHTSFHGNQNHNYPYSFSVNVPPGVFPLAQEDQSGAVQPIIFFTS
ncbi:unnamed protein product [Amoebophrya sp. A25]|nr:unnamed protein product [Amoebophrya sp. A25]|eukprot:GSA25T00008191001.1